MYVLIFAILTFVVVVMGILAYLHSENDTSNIRVVGDIQTMMAQSGAQVFMACKGEPAGVYTIQDLISAGKLPVGYSQQTVSGNSWICQVSSGGVNGGNVTLALWDAPPLQSGKYGQGSFQNNASLQSNLAWNTASVLKQQLAAETGAVAGVISSGSTSMVAEQNHAVYNLAGMINAPSYTTPAVEEGLTAAGQS